MASRCDCHDLLLADCDALKTATDLERAASKTERDRIAALLALPSVTEAQYGGICGGCHERFLAGTPIIMPGYAMGQPDPQPAWVAACCLDDNGRAIR